MLSSDDHTRENHHGSLERHETNKTAFVTAYLQDNPEANATAVRDAWSDAGHADSISTSLVQTTRSKLGLVGNIRRGVKSNGRTEGREEGEEGVEDRAGDPRAVQRGANRPPAEVPHGQADQMLAEVEGDIDRVVFKLMVIGGMESIEEELRRVRRLVVRSHEA